VAAVLAALHTGPMSVDPLRDELLRPPAEAWRPAKGEVLIGEVVALDEREGFAGVRYPIVSVKTDAGEYVAIHCFHKVLRDELARWEPRVGERLGVAYHGRVDKGESQYELYRVKVVRGDGTAGGEPDWEAIRRGAEAEHGEQAVEEPHGAGVPEQTSLEDDDSIPF
jgi:hypothetical protein